MSGGLRPEIAFEDLKAGQRMSFGPRVVTGEEIVTFARDWDPQPFHLDQAAAAKSPYGGLIASGWHTAVVCMRLAVDGLLSRSTSIGSPGIDELKWLKPVRPGDALTLEVALLEVMPSKSKPDRGSVRVGYTCTNQKGETVLTMVARVLFLRRSAPPAG